MRRTDSIFCRGADDRSRLVGTDANLRGAKCRTFPGAVIRTLLLAALTGGFILPAAAQVAVQLNITPPPLNQLKLADLWKVQIVNTGRTEIPVFFQGEITEATDGLVVDGESAPIALRPGVMLITGQQVEPVDIGYGDPRYERALIRTGGAPSGVYQICVRAIHTETGEVLAEDCITHEVNLFNPPILISPIDGEVVRETYPTFVWTPATGGGANRVAAQSRIIITARYGRQSYLAAVNANPPWFEGVVPGSTFRYPGAARRFQEGNYAWRIVTVDPTTGRDIAESDVGHFRWQPQQVVSVVVAELQKIPGIPNAITDELLAPCTGAGGIVPDKDVIVLEQGTGGGAIIQPGGQLQIDGGD